METSDSSPTNRPAHLPYLPGFKMASSQPFSTPTKAIAMSKSLPMMFVTIMLYLSKYVNENAEKLRYAFVSHEGKKSSW